VSINCAISFRWH